LRWVQEFVGKFLDALRDGIRGKAESLGVPAGHADVISSAFEGTLDTVVCVWWCDDDDNDDDDDTPERMRMFVRHLNLGLVQKKCLHCNHESRNHQPFLTLSIDVPASQVGLDARALILPDSPSSSRCLARQSSLRCP
jgi:hypothetical protein